jgi:Cyclin, N-terminal domain
MMMDIETSSLTLHAMLKQEETCYLVEDYFQLLPSLETCDGLPVDESARQEIGQWFINIMDACSYSRDTAAVAMSCLDRFVSTSDGYQFLLDRSSYQLAALTAVYVSVKVHCPQALSPDLVAKLSQGTYTRQDIETMERRMLSALQWRVNPPTAMDFVRAYLALIPSVTLDKDSRRVIVELVGYQADLSILDFELATARASHVAFASLLNAVERVHGDHLEICNNVAERIALSTDICHSSLMGLRVILHEAIMEQTMMEPFSTDTSGKPQNISKRMHRDSFEESPRSVYNHGIRHPQGSA